MLLNHKGFGGFMSMCMCVINKNAIMNINLSSINYNFYYIDANQFLIDVVMSSVD